MAKQTGLNKSVMHTPPQRRPVVVLDDQIVRHESFLRYLGNCFDSLYTAESLLTIIEGEGLNAETLFLDRDLGPGMNGSEMVKYMIEHDLKMPSVKKIVVHSGNAGMGLNMVEDLSKAYPDIQVVFIPISQINDLYKENGCNREAMKAYLLDK